MIALLLLAFEVPTQLSLVMPTTTRTLTRRSPIFLESSVMRSPPVRERDFQRQRRRRAVGASDEPQQNDAAFAAAAGFSSAASSHRGHVPFTTDVMLKRLNATAGTRFSRAEEAALVEAARQESRLQDERVQLLEELGRQPTAFEWALRTTEDGSVATLVKRREMARIAKTVLLENHAGLVRTVVQTYSSFLHDDAISHDLVQEGTLGLIHAIEKFDSTKGVRLATYAVYWIRVFVAEWLRHATSSFYLPRSYVDLLRRSTRERDDFSAENGREPTARELSQVIGIEPAKLQAALDLATASKYPSEIDTSPLNADGTASDRETFVAKTEDLDYRRRNDLYMKRHDILRALEDALDSDELRIIRLRYGLIDGRVRPIRETATLLGVGRNKVHTTCLKAFRRLRGTRLGSRLLDYTQ